MREVLHEEIAKERCNAKAFGAYTAAINIGVKSGNKKEIKQGLDITTAEKSYRDSINKAKEQTSFISEAKKESYWTQKDTNSAIKTRNIYLKSAGEALSVIRRLKNK